MPPLPSSGSKSSSKTSRVPRDTTRRTTLFLPWIWEFIACVAGCAITVAMAGVLGRYDHKRTAEWPSTITLNAFLSVLVTILYILLMVPISKIISQLKWHHYIQREPMHDMEVFDRASRSPFGSLLFAMRRPRWTLAWLAALLVIAVTAIGPFVQQILSLEIAPVSSGNATIPLFNWTSSYFEEQKTASDGQGKTQTGTQADLTAEAAYLGLFAHTLQNFDVQSTCVNANCIWAPFWTMAVESECRNLTDQLEAEILNSGNSSEVRYRLPNGFSVSNRPHGEQHTRLITYDMTARFPSIAFNDRGLLLANFFFLVGGFDLPQDERQAGKNSSLAMECVLQLTGQNIQAEYRNGAYTETLIGNPIHSNTIEGIAISPWRGRVAVVAPPEARGNYERATGVGDLFLRIIDNDRGAHLSFFTPYILVATEGLIELLQSIDTGYTNANNTGASFGRASFDAAESLYRLVTNNFESNPLPASLTFEERAQNLARSLTSGFRSSVWPSQVLVNTSGYRDTLVYKVTWGWIALPVSLCVLTTALLGLIVSDMSAKGMPKWSDSCCALVAFGGGDQELRDAFVSMRCLGEVEEYSRKQFVNLDSNCRLTPKRL